MPYVDILLSFSFTDAQRQQLVFVLNKFPESYTDIHEIKERLKHEGSTVLFRCQAMILAGIVQPYYPEATEKIRSHPDMSGKQVVGL